MNSPEKLSSAGTTPNKQVRGADRPSDHRGWPPEQPWLKVRTGVAKSPDTCGSHAGIYSSPHQTADKMTKQLGHAAKTLRLSDKTARLFFVKSGRL